MTSLVLWVTAISIFMFFRQELSGYFSFFENRRYITVFVLITLMSYASISLYENVHVFLVIIFIQSYRLKMVIYNIIPFNGATYVINYGIHFIVIAILLFAFARYESKRKSLIYQDQILLLRQIMSIIFLCLMLNFSYAYDLI